MKIAILSDIHSNCFALKAVIDEFDRYSIEKVIILGDIFGYYPWAAETFEVLQPYLSNSYAIKGNHDQLVLERNPPDPIPIYWESAKQNEKALRESYPEAIQWLKTLQFENKIAIEGISLHLVHGTPNNAFEGRFYPDNLKHHDWFPKDGEVLLLGHTHYPMLKQTETNGIIFNPGSVGQPRDGDPMPSWGVLNLSDKNFQFIRSRYDNIGAMKKLEKMGWPTKIIEALKKETTNS